VARRVLVEVARTGPLFFDRYATLTGIIQGLEKMETNIHRAYLAVAYTLSGEPARVPEVLAPIERWLAANQGGSGLMAGFLTAFRARFG
jgi:hypothetical protein